MAYKKSSLSIILHSIVGFIILIILLIITNILVSSINNNAYLDVVEFLNSLLGLFIVIFLIGMINSLFWNFEFPLNLLAPLSGGLLGVFIVDLVYRILGFTQNIVYFDVLGKFLAYPISTIVFFATIIIGYLIILNEEGRREEKYPGEERKFREERYAKEEIKRKEIKEKERREKKKPSKSGLTWEDVEQEFRKISFNIGDAVNKAFDGKDKKKKKKR